jgi:DNA-binding Lrp family transcriptional regulator
VKTNVHENSLASIWALRDAGELPEKERIVYEALRQHGPLTREQIAQRTGMKESSSCGRVAGLMEKGLIEPAGVRRNPVTGKSNEVVRIATHRADRQLDLLEAA